ncbi:MAG TPA: hypothetical protein VLA66_04930 [Thermoanaerobaculia bacterium]|nr:hypothetical protein [Thermoanaerobaculia bacterium]
MSEPVAPQPEAPKKGLSTGAKIAIGCLLAVVLVAGGCFVVTAFVLKKGADKLQDFAEEMEKNPDAALIRMTELTLRANPEVEVVSSDPEAGTITVRNKKDGKEITFNLEDIKSGKLSIEADGETVNIDVTESGEEGGTMTFESSRGTAVFGAGDADAVPDWVPAYPDARNDGYSRVEVNDEISGTFTLHTADDAGAVLDYYEQALEEAGFEVRKTTMEGGVAQGNLNASSGNRTVNVTVVSQEGETQGLVAYSEKP